MALRKQDVDSQEDLLNALESEKGSEELHFDYSEQSEESEMIDIPDEQMREFLNGRPLTVSTYK